ncbi:MAG: hypothetical protein QM760_17210 [Nibricoccus sp.]
MKTRIVFAALTWAVLMASSAAQDPKSEAVSAYESKDYLRCISVAGYIERTSGPTPLTTGLIALSTHALGGDEDATAQALEKYQNTRGAGTSYDSQLSSLIAQYREKAEQKKKKEKEDQEKAAADEKKKAAEDLKNSARQPGGEDPLAQAIEAYSSGDQTRCLGIVAALELQQGPSPKLESLRALSLHETGKDDALTFKSLERYWEMTRDNASIFNNENHRELMTLLDDYRKKLEERKKEEADERRKKADEAAQAAERRLQESIQKRASEAQRQSRESVARVADSKLSKLTPSDYQFLKSSDAHALASRFNDRIFSVEKHLLSGPFRLDMGATAFKKLYQSRIAGVQTESAVVQRLQGQSTDAWVEFPFGFVVPLRSQGDERRVLDQGKFFSSNDDDPLLYDEKVDGKAMIDVTNQLTAAGLKPFLGLNENWKLVFAELEQGEVYILSFATTVGKVTGHNDVLKKLTDVFGPLQPFNGAPKGFLEYAPDEGLRGGRFMFPQANGITLDGRIFQSKETLVDSPWILELRVSRMLFDTALFHEFFSVEAHKSNYATFSKRYAEQAVREARYAAGGLKVDLAGRSCTLEKSGTAFFFYEGDSGGATYIVNAKDTKTGDPVVITYSDVNLSSARETAYSSHWSSAVAQTYTVHLTQPARVETKVISNGEEVVTHEETLVVPFYVKDGIFSPIQTALVAALPPVQTLSAEDFDRLKFVFGYHSRVDSVVFPFFQEAERQGKFKDLFFLAMLADDSAKPALLTRAAKGGSVQAMNELRRFYDSRQQQDGKKARDKMVYWAKQAADAGDTDSLKYMVHEERYTDLLATERWMKSLQEKGRWQDEFRPELEQGIIQRADIFRKLAPLSLEAKAQAYGPIYEPNAQLQVDGVSAIGKKFKDYATPEKQFALIEKPSDDRSGKKVKVYRRGQSVHGGPVQVWVNRKGIIIGEYYLLGHGYSDVSAYEAEFACFKQYFGAANLSAIPSTNLKASALVNNSAKTIELLLFDGQAYLKYIDHTLE